MYFLLNKFSIAIFAFLSLYAARVWYSENKIADFSSNFVINPIQFLYSDVCDMRHHDSGSLQEWFQTNLSTKTFADLVARETRGSGTVRIKSPISPDVRHKSDPIFIQRRLSIDARDM